MKLTLPGNEVSKAVQQYLRNTYSMYGEVSVQELHEVEVEILPIDMFLDKPKVEESNAAEGVDTDREDVINRADHLGIKYRSDISTEKLIERIEEQEMRNANQLFNPEITNNDGEDLFPEHVVGELHDGNVGELRVDSDEPKEEVSDETAQDEEAQPEKKKKSIFAKD